MTMDEIQAALDADPEKVKLFEAALNSEEARSAGSDADAFSLAAAAAGLEITPEEAEQFFASQFEVDDSELKHVAGGVDDFGTDRNGHDNWCLTAYHCYAATLHTDGGERSDTSCWSDWRCWGAVHASCSDYVRCWSSEN